MRLLEICTGPGLGGLELYFLNCVRWFSKSNLDVIALTASKTRLEEKLITEELPHLIVNNPGKTFPLKVAFQLSHIISKNQIDIVHIHHKKDLALVALAKTLSKRPFKVIHTRHMEMPHSKKDPYHKYVYSAINLFITVTEQLRNDLIEKLPIPSEKIILEYLGVKAPLPKDNAICNALISDKHHPFLVGVFSRIEEHKGQHLIIEAAKLLKEKHGDKIQYVFMGDVMEQAYMQRLEEKINQYDLNKDMHFKGFHPDPMQLMPCFDIIVMPSKRETFGLVLAEAMRSEVAVIGTDSGGVPEIIDDKVTGFLFEWDNPVELAEKIEILYKDPTLKNKMALAGKEKADKLFNAETHFSRLEKIIRELYDPN